MSDDAILAIDQGTSGTKAIVVDHDDGVIAEVEHPVSPQYLPDGGVELDPWTMLSSVVAAGQDAVSQAGRPVSHVALANQGESVLAWDLDSGRPLSPTIIWQDRRAESVCARVRKHAELLARKTGLVLDPYFSAPKMTWLRKNVTRDGVVTTTDSWLVHQLCGEFVTDASTASRSLLLDVDAVTWDEQLAEIFDLADEALPAIVDCDQAVGTTTSFGPQMTLGGLIVDQPAALLAQRCYAPGEAKCTFGTGAFLLANTGTRAVRSKTGLTTSVGWRTSAETAYYLDGQVYTVASAVRWLTELGIIAGAQELDTFADTESDGVLCVPALAGLAAPWWQPNARAAFTGMTLSTKRGQLVVALLEGIAAQVVELMEVVAHDVGQPLRTLRVDGGLTRSAALMQAVANIAQLPVELYPSPHATSLGAAALAQMSRHPGMTIRDAVDEWQPHLTYEPRWTTDRTQEFRSRWRAAATANLPHQENPSA